MITRSERVMVLALVAALAACTSTSSGVDTAAPVEATVAPPASTTAPSVPDAPFPIATFAAISQDPVTEESAAKFRAALNEMAGASGMSATVMTAESTWRTAGTADGASPLTM